MASWIIPCNTKYYDVFSAFKELKELDWKQSTKIEEGDIVYIYLGQPYGYVKYRCIVVQANKESITIDDTKYQRNPEVYVTYPVHMQLRLLETYEDENYFSYKEMKMHGFKGRPMGPRRLDDELRNYFESYKRGE